MKTISTALITAASLAIVSCDKSQRQSAEVETPKEVKEREEKTPAHADAKFKDGMTERIFQDYLRLRTALFREDDGEARDAAKDIGESLSAERREIKLLATELAEEEDLGAQRELFGRLTAGLRPLFKDGLTAGTLYVMSSPADTGDRKATWVSDSKDKQNPYLGQAKAVTGEILETVSPAKSGPPELPEVPAARADEAKVPDGYQVEIVLRDLTFPTSLEFGPEGGMYVAEAGYSYGAPDAVPKILKVTKDGRKSEFVSAGLVGPVNDLLWHEGKLFVSHRGKISTADANGVNDLVTGLPSEGDHHNNQMTAGPDGKIYFGQGTYTNSAVVGPDNFNMGWLKKHPDLHDIPARDIQLLGKKFISRNPLDAGDQDARTLPYRPFNQPGEELTVKGATKASGTILRMNPDGSELEMYAWGLRNPYGVLWLPDGRLLASENGFDARGSRPIANDKEDLYLVEKGAWYGWPDYASGIPVTDPQFAPQDGPPPEFLMAEHPPVKKPLMTFPEHSAVAKMAWSAGPGFGRQDHLFVAFFGHMSPMTGKTEKHGGHRVVAINLKTGELETFFGQKGHGSGGGHGSGAEGETGDGHDNGTHHGKGGDAESSGGETATAGPRRPLDVQFGPEGALYVVDFGTLVVKQGKVVPVRGTGLVWKITRSAESQQERPPENPPPDEQESKSAE